MGPRFGGLGASFIFKNIHFNKSALMMLCLLVFLSVAVADEAITAVYRTSVGAAVSLVNYKLEGYQFKTIIVWGIIACGQHCLSEIPRCRSYNVEPMASEYLCELNSEGISDATGNGIGGLTLTPGAVFVQNEGKLEFFKNCRDQYKYGARKSGLYYVQASEQNLFPVYCDFTSEPGRVWTLVMSMSLENHRLPEFFSTSFPEDRSLSENIPNWKAYRLSKTRMESIHSTCTHWRVTCDFVAAAVNYRDYMRASNRDFNVMKFDGKNVCKKVEYINVMGHNCEGCTASFFQFPGQVIHHDSTTNNGCDFPVIPQSVSSQDNFGLYDNYNQNFRCTASNNSTTNYWFGGHV